MRREATWRHEEVAAPPPPGALNARDGCSACNDPDEGAPAPNAGGEKSLAADGGGAHVQLRERRAEQVEGVDGPPSPSKRPVAEAGAVGSHSKLPWASMWLGRRREQSCDQMRATVRSPKRGRTSTGCAFKRAGGLFGTTLVRPGFHQNVHRYDLTCTGVVRPYDRGGEPESVAPHLTTR